MVRQSNKRDHNLSTANLLEKSTHSSPLVDTTAPWAESNDMASNFAKEKHQLDPYRGLNPTNSFIYKKLTCGPWDEYSYRWRIIPPAVVVEAGSCWRFLSLEPSWDCCEGVEDCLSSDAFCTWSSFSWNHYQRSANILEVYCMKGVKEGIKRFLTAFVGFKMSGEAVSSRLSKPSPVPTGGRDESRFWDSDESIWELSCCSWFTAWKSSTWDSCWWRDRVLNGGWNIQTLVSLALGIYY